MKPSMIFAMTPVEEIIARTLEAAARCMDQSANPPSREAMKVTFSQIARDAAPWKLSGEDVIRIYLRPIQEMLNERYPISDATRIYWDFFDLFWPLSRTGSIRHWKNR